MDTVLGTFVDGKMVPEFLPNKSNGTSMAMKAEMQEDANADNFQGDDPESISRWIEWSKSLEPLLLTAEDEQRIGQAQKEQREFEFATWEVQGCKLEKPFEEPR
ncbi:MAG TPA: hypothetical protein VGL71_06640 [Urbifossiella sp.]